MSEFLKVRFTWSAIIISAPRAKVRLTPPAALVRISVPIPSSAMTRTGIATVSAE
jgi:hypothetical protein